MSHKIEVTLLNSLPILHTYNGRVFTIIRIDEKDRFVYNFEIRDSASFEVVFKDTIISDTYLTVFYDTQNVIFCGYGLDKYVLDLVGLKVEKIVSKHPFYNKYMGYYIGMDLDSDEYILMDSDLQVVNRKLLDDVFWAKSVLVQNSEISGNESQLTIVEPISFDILWERTYNGSVSIKNCTEILLFIQIHQPGNNLFQIIETKTGIIKYQSNRSVSKVIIEESQDLAFVSNWEGIILISLKDFRIKRSFSYPRMTKVTGMVGVSDKGILYTGSMRESFFGLMDRDTGEKLWEHDYIPEGADTLTITHWVPLQNGKHILGCFIPKASAVFEFEPQ